MFFSTQAVFVFTGQGSQLEQQGSQVPTTHFLHSIIISSPFNNRFMSGVTLTQLFSRLAGAIKPAESFIFTEAHSTDICRPNPYEQSPGNAVGISHLCQCCCNHHSSGICGSYRLWVHRLHLPGAFVPCFPTSDRQDKSSVMVKTSGAQQETQELSRACRNS